MVKTQREFFLGTRFGPRKRGALSPSYLSPFFLPTRLTQPFAQFSIFQACIKLQKYPDSFERKISRMNVVGILLFIVQSGSWVPREHTHTILEKLSCRERGRSPFPPTDEPESCQLFALGENERVSKTHPPKKSQGSTNQRKKKIFWLPCFPLRLHVFLFHFVTSSVWV